MLNEQLPNLLVWALLWGLSWGFFLLYLFKRIDYIKYFIWTSIYFLSIAVATLLIFRDYMVRILQNFTPLPFIVLTGVITIGTFLYFYIPKHFGEPIDYFQKHPKRQYFVINPKRLFSKSAELLFQQVFIVLLVLFLQDAGLTIGQTIIAFAVIFGLAHIPLILIERGAWPSWYFTVFSILSAIVFPVLILKVQYGFIYSYIVHWTFYTFTAVGFWIWYNKCKESYQCKECGLKYADRKWAAKCEEWCKKHKSCNLEIIEYAIKN